MNDGATHDRVPVALELRDVTYRRGDALLLDGITLRLPRHTRTVIMGPNGAGKTLLLRVCHGLLRATAGRIQWNSDANARHVHQAMVFQRPVLLRRSALANITYSLALKGVPRRRRAERARQALARFGLEGLAARPARVLSGGEQQRVAIARAWALGPTLVFLDEPTTGLDPAAAKAVEDAINAFHDVGTKVVMTTHDLAQARRLADDVVFLCRGRAAEHTSAAVFFEAPVSSEARAFVRGELVL